MAFASSIASLGVAFHAQAKGSSRGYTPTDYLALEGKPAVSGIELHFYPHRTLTTLAANGWPSSLSFDEYPLNQASPKHSIQLTGLQRVHGAMISNAFVQYFEANRSLAEAKFSKDTQRWPMEWNFGRVVRNALVHKGSIRIDNKNASAVTWKSLSYSHSENGKQILYRDVTAVELVLLMEEMDALL